MASNDMNFLADLLPSAIIKVITIETAGGLTKLETNPHIVEESVPVYKRAALQRTLGTEGGAKMESIMKSMGVGLSSTSMSGTDLAAVGAAAGLQTSNKETTMVTLDCAITDTLDYNDSAGQWFMSGDITKYLFIFAVQFSSKRALNSYKKLLASASGPAMQIAHLFLGDKMTAAELRSQSRKLKIPGVGNLIKSKNDITWNMVCVQDIINDIDSGTTGEAVTEQDLMLAGLSSIDTNGNTVYEFPAKFQFEINSATPNHAAYYICPILDIEALLSDNNLTSTTVDTASAQYSTNGQWVTAISAGELNLGDSRISDFRDVNDVVPAHSVDLSTINMLDELASGTAQNFTTLPAYRHNYFSDIHLSTFPSRECGFMFAFSQLDFMKDNSVYGRFFDNVADDIADRVLAKCTIEELKIIRRRVKHHKQGAYARGYPNVYEAWDNSQVDHVVASTKATPKGKLQASRLVLTTDTGGSSNTSHTPSGGIREINLKTNSTNGKDFRVRHFTGKDSQVKKHTDGIYQYGVEVTIRDYVPVYIGERLKMLKDQIARLEEYQVFANIPVVNRYQQTHADPHVGTKRADQQTDKAPPVVNIIGGESTANINVSSKTQVGFYDPTINKFTQDFVRFAERKYAKSPPWQRAPQIFVELADLIVNNKVSDAEKLKVTKNLTSVCNPRSGTPRGIASVIRTLETYAKIVEDLISAQPATSNSSAAENPNTAGAGSGVTNRTVTHKIYFSNNAFNADEPPSTGVSYMNMSTSGDSTSLPMMASSHYLERVAFEIEKYFIDPTAAPVAPAAFKCLSPISINVLKSGNTVNLRAVNNRYDSSDRAEMAETFRKIVQYMGSQRKAAQSRILTIDSQNRVGQAIAPEFGFSLMSPAQYENALFNRTNTGGRSAQPFSTGGDTGAAADAGAPTLEGISITTAEEEEIDYIDVFPSAMATSEWGSEQTTGTLVDALSNLQAGFETEDESTFLVQMLINTRRDLMHSTTQHPARAGEVNFSPLAIMQWVVGEAASTEGVTWETMGAVLVGIMGQLPISIQAAAVTATVGSEIVHPHIVSRLGPEYWNDPVYNILYQLHFMMNARVEYLVGYRDSNLQPKYMKTIGSEIWAPLTKIVVESLDKSEGQQILCRLRPYNNEALRIASPKALKMPIWNSKFLMVGNNGKPLSGIKRKMGFTAPKIQSIRKGLY
jgi:hypothetical protein